MSATSPGAPQVLSERASMGLIWMFELYSTKLGENLGRAALYSDAHHARVIGEVVTRPTLVRRGGCDMVLHWFGYGWVSAPSGACAMVGFPSPVEPHLDD